MFDMLLPAFNKNPSNGLNLGLLIGFNVVFALSVLSFLLLVSSDPGGVPISWQVKDGDLEGGPQSEDSSLLPKETTEKKHDGTRRICRKSKPPVYKPDRAHYCRISRRCILKMDHFCPWLNNCVGYYNQKYFVLFLFYCALMTNFMVFYSGDEFGRVMSRLDDVPVDVTDRDFRICATYMLLCILNLGITGFFGFHAHLVAYNYTTIEFLEKRGCNPPPGYVNRYDIGTWGNITTVMGNNPLLWPFPVRAGIVGDGLSYPINPKYKDVVSR